jgi:hypothetical protein
MKSNGTSFALGNLFGSVVVGAIAVACSNSDSPPASANVGTIAASNVLLANGAATTSLRDGIIRVQASQLPPNVQVLASQVTLVTTGNDLSSGDLQTALDKELAVDLSRTLVGAWNVENITDDQAYTGATSTGRVAFAGDGTYSVTSGGFAAAGRVAPGTDSPCYLPTSTSYTMVDGAIFFQSNGGGNSVATVAKATADAITLIGDGGCGAQGISRISRLTRVGTQPAALQHL